MRANLCVSFVWFAQRKYSMLLFHVNCWDHDSLTWITSSAKKRPLSAMSKCCKTIGRIHLQKEVEKTEESNQDNPRNIQVLWLHIIHGALKSKWAHLSITACNHTNNKWNNCLPSFLHCGGEIGVWLLLSGDFLGSEMEDLKDVCDWNEIQK